LMCAVALSVVFTCGCSGDSNEGGGGSGAGSAGAGGDATGGTGAAGAGGVGGSAGTAGSGAAGAGGSGAGAGGAGGAGGTGGATGGTAGLGGVGGTAGAAPTSYPWLAVTSGQNLTLVGIEDLTDIKSARLSNSGGFHAWSPDGNAILLHDAGKVVVQRVDETGPTESFTITTANGYYPDTAWSRDGQVVSAVTENRELRLLPAYQDLPTTTVLTYQAIELQWSPTRNEFLLLNGYPSANQLYVGLPDGSLRQIGEAGAAISEMSWSADGDYVQYRTSSQTRFVVSRDASGTDPGASIPASTYFSWIPGGHQFATYGSSPARLFDAANVGTPTDLSTESASGFGASPSGKYFMWRDATSATLYDTATQTSSGLAGDPYPSSAVWNHNETRLTYTNATGAYLAYLDTSSVESVGLVSPATTVHISPIAQTAFYAVGSSVYLRDVSANPPGTSLPVYSTGSQFVTVGAIGWAPRGDRVLYTQKAGSTTTVQALKVEGLAASAPVQIFDSSGLFDWQPR
ncbi:MAG: hypothetical protein KC492_30915, partial [Myxococcales bacterium]|nr:hypothetical protein [Myxococcales bacterium]